MDIDKEDLPVESIQLEIIKALRSIERAENMSTFGKDYTLFERKYYGLKRTLRDMLNVLREW